MALESYITSIQHVEIEVSDTSNSANLEAGTDITNCVPIVSMKTDGTSDDWDDIMCDIYFTAGSPPTITVERNGSDGTIYASIFIVEFDGTNVVVQQGTFSMDSSHAADQQSISEITTTKAFALAYHKMGGTGDDDWDHAMVKCWFSDATHIDFERDQATGEISGHWYLAEAQGTEFATQAIDIAIDSGETQDSQEITSVDLSKTIILATYESTVAGDDMDDDGTRVWLEDATHVYARRYASDGDIYIKGWAIQFDTGSNISVQRGFHYYDDNDTSGIIDITGVTQANSIINNPSYYGSIECEGAASENVEGGWQKLTFVDSDTIKLERDNGYYGGLGVEATGNWEVIDFTAAGGVTPTYSGRGIGRGILRGVMR